MFSRKPHNNPDSNFGENTNPNTSYNDPNSPSHGTGSGNTETRGPHKSSLLNKLDPRVDNTTGQQTTGSNRNDGGAFGTSPRHENTGYGNSLTGHGDTTGGYGTGNTSHGSGITGRNTGSTTSGPHDSSLANKVCSLCL